MLLDQALFENKTEEVARALLGCYLIRETEEGLVSGIIVETEAYLSDHDPACHASRGLTRGNATMFGRPGHAYIYFIYGNYYCFNVVTGAAGLGEAVLIRAVEPVEGLDLMFKRRGPGKKLTDLASGPGKLCQAFSITKELNGHDLQKKPLYLGDDKLNRNIEVAVTPRIGISTAKDRKLRFIISGNNYLSRREPFDRCNYRAGD